MAHRAKSNSGSNVFDGVVLGMPSHDGTPGKSPDPTKASKAAKPVKPIKLVNATKEDITQGDSPKSQAKSSFTRLQVYVTRSEVNAALQREAQSRKMSLSQAASAMIERGLRGRIEPDADNRLLTLERRLSDHMRTSSRDLMIIEEMIFSTLKVLMTRFPHDASLEDPTYQAAIDAKMSSILDDVARRIGTHNLVRLQEAEAEKEVVGTKQELESLLEASLPAVANDIAASASVSFAILDDALTSSKPDVSKTTTPKTI